MIIEMVTGKVSENTSRENKTSYTLLTDAVAAYLHEGIGTALVRHLTEQTVQGNGVWCRDLSRNGLTINIVTNSTAKATLVTESAENII